jgi:hypothetical protein
MHSRFTRWATGAAVALSLFAGAGMAQASSLTSTQVSAILSLLQSFGASQSVINNVAASLGGQPVASTNLSPSCNQFANLTRGETDSMTGGMVSQLQRFLGISPTTGYYGSVTQADYTSRCTGGTSTGSAPTLVSGTTQPSATVDQSSLTQSSPSFSISGSASNVQQVAVDIAGFGSTPSNNPSGYLVFSETVGGANVYAIGTTAPVINGRWSVPFQGIGSGAYKVLVYNDTASTLQQLLQSASAPLTTGVLTVSNGSVSSTPSSATVDQSSLTPSVGTYAITGTAYNTNAVIIASVHSNYSGSTDYNSVSAFVTQNPGAAFFVPESVQNNRWSVNVTTLNPSLISTILVYDASTHDLLTTGTLTITSNNSTATPMCTLTASGYTPSPYTYVPGQIYVTRGSSVVLTWTSQNTAYTTSNFSNGQNSSNGALTVGGLAAATNTYTVTAYNSAGNPGSCSATIYVDQKG